jgi:hypothetical protein
VDVTGDEGCGSNDSSCINHWSFPAVFNTHLLPQFLSTQTASRDGVYTLVIVWGFFFSPQASNYVFYGATPSRTAKDGRLPLQAV